MNMIADFANHPELSRLPILDVIEQSKAILAKGRNLVLVAPPGAGKTSVVPLALRDAVWRQGRKILLVAPRRIAVRNAARRMAQLCQTPLGAIVGFSTRLERVMKPTAEIEVITEGLFVRRILRDPFLEDICAVIFDEAHERTLDLDTGLALALSTQKNLRPDLRLVAMSATLSGESFTKIMQAENVHSDGRAHPLSVHYAARDIHNIAEIPARVAAQIRHALSDETLPKGHILVFLPGMKEIRQTQALLDAIDADLLILHGDLPVETQDLVFASSSRRRVILATAIAETSLTIPETRTVIDSGFRRAPRFDPGSGLTQLDTVRISRAAAEQRAGRAGRVGPGVAYRLWSEAAHRGLPRYDAPEIASADVSALIMQLKLWEEVTGLTDAAHFLLQPPAAGAIEGASKMLHALGALKDGQLTALGKKMSAFGAHPRLAAILCTATTDVERATASLLCALLEERDPLRTLPEHLKSTHGPASVDIALRFEVLQKSGARGQLVGRIRATAARYLASYNGNVTCNGDVGCIGRLLSAGFPDRIAKATDSAGHFRLATGGRAQVAPIDPLSRHAWIVAAHIQKARATLIALAAPVSIDDLPPAVSATIKVRQTTALDTVSGKIICHERRTLGRLTLSEKNIAVSEVERAALLLHEVRSNFEDVLTWGASSLQLQARVMLARPFKRDLPDLSTPYLANTVQEWLPPWIGTCQSRTQIGQIDLLPILQSFLSWAQREWLDKNLPNTILFPRGALSIDYTQTPPSISARAQAFYGCTRTPSLLQGAIKLQFILLSPANRPQAITSDLAGFWHSGWQDMRRDMRGRYPKHDWPDDPGEASSNRASPQK